MSKPTATKKPQPKRPIGVQSLVPPPSTSKLTINQQSRLKRPFTSDVPLSIQPPPMSKPTATKKPQPKRPIGVQPPVPSSSTSRPTVTRNLQPSMEQLVSKKAKTHHRVSPEPQNTSDLRPKYRSPPLDTSTLHADLDDLPVFAYDLDQDPTLEFIELKEEFIEPSPHMTMISARHIRHFLSQRSSRSTVLNEEPTNSEGDLRVAKSS
jgi:hypothetical protein